MTVPYGGDSANPMVQGDSGPGKIGYVLGTLLILIGVVGGGAWLGLGFVDIQDTVDDFDRVPVDEVRTFDLDAGDYVVYGEKGGGDPIAATLASFRIRPEGEGGDAAELPVDVYEAEFTYDVGDRPLRALYTFEIEEAGEYQVVGEGIRTGATTVAIGPSIVDEFVTALVGGLVVGLVGVLIGIIVLLVTGRRRRKFRQRGWQGGWGGGEPGSWNPQPGFGAPQPGFGAPQQPGSWNPPPPSNYPSSGSFPPPPG